MPEEPLDRTVLFADVAGSTRLYEQIGDGEARALLLACLDDAARGIADAGGEVVERIGDELLCLFEAPETAARAAVSVQRGRERAPRAPGGRPLRLRIGFAHGAVTRTERGVFGATVHRAARVVALAKAGQVLLPIDTLERLHPSRRATSRLFDRVVLRGQAGEQEIHELVWNALATVRRPSARRSRPAMVRVELQCGDRHAVLDPVHPVVEIGRDPACELCADGWTVSQLHARVRWESGRAVLEDVSTNGCVVRPAGDEPRPLHHDQVPLSGEGEIELGDVGQEGSGGRVRYRCVAPPRSSA